MENRKDSLPRERVIHIVFHSLWVTVQGPRIPDILLCRGRDGRHDEGSARGDVQQPSTTLTAHSTVVHNGVGVVAASKDGTGTHGLGQAWTDVLGLTWGPEAKYLSTASPVASACLQCPDHGVANRASIEDALPQRLWSTS